MATLENHMSQIPLLSESEKTHAKEAMLPISHTQWNEKRGMKDYCDQNALLILTRSTKETAALHEANDLACFSMLYVLELL